EADDDAIASVKLHDGAAPRFLMQVIDILRDQLMHAAALLERRERAMRRVRPRCFESRPSAKAARPVKAPHLRAPHEGGVLNRLVPRPRAARTAIVRNARLGAAARAGKDDEPPRRFDEVAKRGHAFPPTNADARRFPLTEKRVPRMLA